MNDFQRANLVRHRDWLVANRGDIVGFDMGSYGSDDKGVGATFVDECMSPACALGWTVRSMPELTAPNQYFSTVASELLGVPAFSKPYDYLFGIDWGSLDNTLDGAIERMTAFIDNDFAVPADAVMP